MQEIGVFTPDQARALWQDYLSRASGPGNSQKPVLLHQVDKCVILDESIAVATDSKTGATSGLATVCYWSITDEEFTESDEQITVYNHSESTGHDEDTFGVARWIAGHWWFFGDCAAMAER